MATLLGHAIPMDGYPWDHAYATSDEGDQWPCHGRSAGGRTICRGAGSSALARCIAQPDLMAGIDYGVTGVCHQMANRILYPAEILVTTARGYIGSLTIWGSYGVLWPLGPKIVPPWPELEGCRKHLAGDSQDGGGSGGSGFEGSDDGGHDMGSDKSGELARRITALYEAAGLGSRTKAETPLPDLRPAELQAAIDVVLGQACPQQKRDAVDKIQRELHGAQADIASKLAVGSLSPEEYLERLRALIDQTFARCEETLGARDFRALFGGSAKEISGLIDSAAFLSAHRR